MRTHPTRILLATLDVFVALTATGGGIAAATGVDPLPSEWLEGTPFRSYMIPGILLALLVGGSATAASVMMLRRSHNGPAASGIAGIILMGWVRSCC